MEMPNTGDRTSDEREVMVAINRLLEEWIRERPEQWLWLHRRWPD
jgi:KDO2-lipid IV(A) lauroyltransferase